MGEIIITSKADLTLIIQQVMAEALKPLLTQSITAPESIDDVFLNIEQAATYLHKKRSTIYYLVGKRVIPAYKRGGRLLFKKIELKKWVEKSKRKTNDELALIVKQRSN